MKIRLISSIILILLNIISHPALAQKNIPDKIIFKLIAESDSEFIKANKLFLVQKASHFFSQEYIRETLNTIGLDSPNFLKFQLKTDSINSLNKIWNFKSRKMKIYPNSKKTDNILHYQIHHGNSKTRFVKYIRFGCSPALYWNNYYLISYWLEYGGLSRRGKVAIVKFNNKKFEIEGIYRLPGGS